MISVSDFEMETILDVIAKHASDCNVLAFGSRYKWTPKDYSDLDLAFAHKNGKKLGLRRIGEIAEAFLECELPYRVDVVDYNAVSNEFKKIIDAGHEVIFKSKDKSASGRGRFGLTSDDWKLVRAADFIDFNPRESISKGTMAKKVGMERLQPFCREIPSYEIAPFNGGSKFRNGDTIMARITPCLENGKTAQVNILESGEVGFGSTEFIVLREKQGISDKDFIYYLAMSPILREKAIKSMVGSSGRQRVQQGVVNDTEFFAPPISEQIEIGQILGVLDDKIANNTKINHHLEQMAQAIFKSWFVDFEPWGGEQPTEWRDSSIGEVCDVKGGKRLPKGENLTTTPNSHPYIRVRDMNDALFVQMTSSVEYVPDEIQSGISRYIVSANDVIISIVGTIGLVCIVHPTLDNANLTENCVKLTNHTGVSSPWLYLFLSSDEGQEQIRNVTVGAVQPKLPIKNIQSISFSLPPISVMDEFDGVVSGLFETIANNYAENTCLAALRDTLLPRLMSGELSITDLAAK